MRLEPGAAMYILPYRPATDPLCASHDSREDEYILFLFNLILLRLEMALLAGKTVAIAFMGILSLTSVGRAVDVRLCTEPSFADCLAYDFIPGICSKKRSPLSYRDHSTDHVYPPDAADLGATVSVESVAVASSCVLFSYVLSCRFQKLSSMLLHKFGLAIGCQKLTKAPQESVLRWCVV